MDNQWTSLDFHGLPGAGGTARARDINAYRIQKVRKNPFRQAWLGNKSFPLSKLDNQRLNTFSNKMIYNWILISPKKQQKCHDQFVCTFAKKWSDGKPELLDSVFVTLISWQCQDLFLKSSKTILKGCLGGSANNNRGDSHHQRLEKLAPLNCLSLLSSLFT